MLVIGLTGGIATGKTTVSAMLKELGAEVLDADRVGHEAYLPDTPTYNEVVSTFGREIVGEDRQINRGKLGAIVFSDPANMKKLTDIMWPRMADIVAERIEEQKARGTGVMVVEAAVLLEAKWDSLTDEVWVTVSPESSMIERLAESRGLTEEQARDRINSQMSAEERIKRVDVVIHNDSGQDELKAQIEEIWNSRVGTRK